MPFEMSPAARQTLPLHKQVIARANELIEDPAHWTQHAYARTSTGRKCPAISDRADRFCVLGAIDRASSEVSPLNVYIAYREALDFIQNASVEIVPFVNDNRGHVAVLALLKGALSMEASRGVKGPLPRRSFS